MKASGIRKTSGLYLAADVLILLILVGFVLSFFVFDRNGEREKETEQDCIFSVEVGGFPEGTDFEHIFKMEAELHEDGSIPLYLGKGKKSFGTLEKTETGYRVRTRQAKEYGKDSALYALKEDPILPGAVLEVRTTLADFTLTVLSAPEWVSADTTAPETESTATS